MNEPDAQGFVYLWPTAVLHRRIPGHEAPNLALAEVITGLENERDDLTTDYLGGNFMVIEHPAVAWLRECVNRSVVDYIRRQGLDYDVRWSLQGWANINRYGDYHDLHNHPHSYLSGTYYVQVPAQDPQRRGRSDLSPGAISFYDPRPQANMNAIRGDAQVNPEHTVLPQPGTILLWPSFLHHFVHPNLSREPRVSVSFNVVLEWVDEYLPPQ